MLTKIEVFNGTSAALSLPFQDISNGYVVQDVQGLDPVRATIVSTKLAQLDGSRRQASRRENRNIVLQLGFIPELANSDVQTLRRALYAYLIPKTLVTLRFHVDGVGFVDIQGEVESCETPLFSAEPEVNVSIICFDPDFYALASSVAGGLTTSVAGGQTVFNYPGSSPAGYLFTLPVTRALSNGFTLYNTLPNGVIQIFDFEDPLASGDTIKLSTVPGSKSITRTRAGVTISVHYGVSPESVWPYFSPGGNSVRVRANGTPGMPYTIEYLAKYGGL